MNCSSGVRRRKCGLLSRQRLMFGLEGIRRRRSMRSWWWSKKQGASHPRDPNMSGRRDMRASAYDPTYLLRDDHFRGARHRERAGWDEWNRPWESVGRLHHYVLTRVVA